MCNVHAMEIIPSQASINTISTYRAKFDNEKLDYAQLLKQLKTVIHEQGFMEDHDTTEWMLHRGTDYLSNPKLFCNAPLTYLCAFLGHLFKTYELEELEQKLSPEILKCALTRLQEFK